MKYPDNKPYILAAKGNYISVIRIDLLLLEIVHVIPSSTLFSPQAAAVLLRVIEVEDLKTEADQHEWKESGNLDKGS